MDVGLPISVVARQLSMTPSTLRTWQQRYGLGASIRSRGGHRRYTSEDLHRLRAALALIADGVRAADAARAALSTPLAALPSEPPSRTTPADETSHDRPVSPAALPINDRMAPTTPLRTTPSGAAFVEVPEPAGRPEITRLSRAALDLDGPTVTTLLTTSLNDRGSTTTWETLVRPVLAEVDSCRRLDGHGHLVAAEHLLTHLITAAYNAHTAQHAQPIPRGHRPVLLACAPAEHHTLPLIALGATLAEDAVHTAVLGARTPVTALTAAVAAHDPCAVVVLSMSRSSAQPSIFSWPSPTDSMLIAAGPGWDTTALPPQISHANGLTPAATLLIATANQRH